MDTVLVDVGIVSPRAKPRSCGPWNAITTPSIRWNRGCAAGGPPRDRCPRRRIPEAGGRTCGPSRTPRDAWSWRAGIARLPDFTGRSSRRRSGSCPVRLLEVPRGRGTPGTHHGPAGGAGLGPSEDPARCLPSWLRSGRILLLGGYLLGNDGASTGPGRRTGWWRQLGGEEESRPGRFPQGPPGEPKAPDPDPRIPRRAGA